LTPDNIANRDWTRDKGHADIALVVFVIEGQVEIGDAGSETRQILNKRKKRIRTIELVNVLGIASKNHSAKPFKKPFPSALTISLTIIPSNLATIILSTVRKTRNAECKATIPASDPRHEGIATRNKMARNCDTKARSMLGFSAACVPRSGK